MGEARTSRRRRDAQTIGARTPHPSGRAVPRADECRSLAIALDVGAQAAADLHPSRRAGDRLGDAVRAGLEVGVVDEPIAQGPGRTEELSGAARTSQRAQQAPRRGRVLRVAQIEPRFHLQTVAGGLLTLPGGRPPPAPGNRSRLATTDPSVSTESSTGSPRRSTVIPSTRSPAASASPRPGTRSVAASSLARSDGVTTRLSRTKNVRRPLRRSLRMPTVSSSRTCEPTARKAVAERRRRRAACGEVDDGGVGRRHLRLLAEDPPGQPDHASDQRASPSPSQSGDEPVGGGVTGEDPRPAATERGDPDHAQVRPDVEPARRELQARSEADVGAGRAALEQSHRDPAVGPPLTQNGRVAPQAHHGDGDRSAVAIAAALDHARLWRALAAQTGDHAERAAHREQQRAAQAGVGDDGPDRGQRHRDEQQQGDVLRRRLPSLRAARHAAIVRPNALRL